MINKQIKILFEGNAKESLKKLNETIGNQIKQKKTKSFEMQLLKSIKEKADLIKKNPFYGNNIPKKLIPKKYNVKNLWRVELTNYWRMLYEITGDEIKIVCFILDFIDHKKYNKLFGYKRR